MSNRKFEAFYNMAKAKADEALNAVAGSSSRKGQLQEKARDYVYENMPEFEKDLFEYVGSLDSKKKKYLNVKNRHAKFSLENFAKNIIKHPELTIKEYLLIPELIEKTEALFLFENENRKKLFCYCKKDKYYKAVIKPTVNKKENFLQTFHSISIYGINKDKKKKGIKIIFDNLP